MKKIMFNDRYSLTQAVLDSRKKVTRRIIPWETITEQTLCNRERVLYKNYDGTKIEPMYNVGEIVAIAQNYNTIIDSGISDKHLPGRYKLVPGWSNKMFVLSDAMPHQIRIINSRLEQLQDITEEDSLLEGVEVVDKGMCDVAGALVWYGIKETNIREFTPRDAYMRLIDKISGRGTWARNPFVFRLNLNY